MKKKNQLYKNKLLNNHKLSLIILLLLSKMKRKRKRRRFKANLEILQMKIMNQVRKMTRLMIGQVV